MLDRSVAALLSHRDVSEVIVALPQTVIDDPPDYLGAPVRLVAGGERRQDSVANAFRAAARESDVIVIHDAARPFVSADLIARTIAAAGESGAAVAALQSRDTVKRSEGPPEGGHPVLFVIETLPRDAIFLAQTPQAFRRDVLASALAFAERTNALGTDEASLAEAAGHRVRLVDGEATNIKITTPDDLVIAEAIAGARSADASHGADPERDGTRGVRRAIRTGRAGTGYDLHRLAAGQPLVIGGVTIPSD